jgi:1-acyl-sn-glycerol-3-phosphate acyltransferase
MSEVAAGRRSRPALPAPPDDDGIDPWGRSERVRAATAMLLEPVARRWFRFGLDGLEHLPTEGGALLVANHAGAIPVDASLLMHVIERDHHRPVYALHHHLLRAVPGLGTFLARNGGVVGHPDNALRLLQEERQLVLVFPEGTKGTTKPFRHRYRLARFGRGGFVETAMRAGVPIVPIAVVGTEEAMPTLFRLPVSPGVQWPVTLNALLLGPAGAFVQFPVTIRARVLPPMTLDEPPSLDRYPTFRVAEVAEQVRSTIQAAVDDLRDQRRAAS